MTRIAIVGGHDIHMQRAIELIAAAEASSGGLIIIDSLGIVEENDMLGDRAWPIHGHRREEIQSYERFFELDEDLKKDEFMAKIRGDHSCKGRNKRRSRGQIRRR